MDDKNTPLITTSKWSGFIEVSILALGLASAALVVYAASQHKTDLPKSNPNSNNDDTLYAAMFNHNSLSRYRFEEKVEEPVVWFGF